MIKRLLLAASVVIFFASCIKHNDGGCAYQSSSAVAPASEVSTLQTWVNSNAPGATQHSTGFFYKIGSPGSGATPEVCSNITVKYTGRLSNGTKFDENLTGYSAILGGLIFGWQKGLPLIKPGGSITLYLPPSLGYGSQDVKDNNGVVIIPANSILVFDIQLIAVQ
jgi:FKBP-type peptidyl-prolyl cis-trans isomerase FkpA